MTNRTTKRIFLLLLQASFFFALSGPGLGAGRQTRTSQGSGSGLRQFDFRNFTYQSTLCTQELVREGIGRTVRVRNGEFKTANAYFLAEKPVFGDLTGDGQVEAVVVIDCNENDANFSLSEIHIFGMKSGRLGLLETFDDRDMGRDYASFYPGTSGELWGIKGVRVTNGDLVVDRLADGSMNCPKSIATFAYHWDGQRFKLNKRLLKRPSGLSC